MIPRRSFLAGASTIIVPRALAAEPEAFRVSGVPTFSATGPHADYYGATSGFPVRGPIYQPMNRVGAFSHLASIFPTNRVERSPVPWQFKRSEVSVSYGSGGRRLTLADYLARNPITGLLIARDDDILFESYQYGRTDRDQTDSHSMAKSITGLLIGIAVTEGAIKSVDDPAEKYVRAFKGTEYGKTSIRSLLHMSSGVDLGRKLTTRET